jgi:hypothetical protein
MIILGLFLSFCAHFVIAVFLIGIISSLGPIYLYEMLQKNIVFIKHSNYLFKKMQSGFIYLCMQAKTIINWSPFFIWVYIFFKQLWFNYTRKPIVFDWLYTSKEYQIKELQIKLNDFYEQQLYNTSMKISIDTQLWLNEYHAKIKTLDDIHIKKFSNNFDLLSQDFMIKFENYYKENIISKEPISQANKVIVPNWLDYFGLNAEIFYGVSACLFVAVCFFLMHKTQNTFSSNKSDFKLRRFVANNDAIPYARWGRMFRIRNEDILYDFSPTPSPEDLSPLSTNGSLLIDLSNLNGGFTFIMGLFHKIFEKNKKNDCIVSALNNKLDTEKITTDSLLNMSCNLKNSEVIVANEKISLDELISMLFIKGESNSLPSAQNMNKKGMLESLVLHRNEYNTATTLEEREIILQNFLTAFNISTLADSFIPIFIATYRIFYNKEFRFYLKFFIVFEFKLFLKRIFFF